MPKHFKFIEVGPSVLGVEFKDFNAMALMFMRVQEYTEGLKKHRGFIASEGDTLIRYLKKKDKLYYSDNWAGYNIKGETFLEIWTNFPYTVFWNSYEQRLFREIKETFGDQFDKYLSGQWYVVSWMKGDKATKNHEICHGEFYLNREYREKVYEVLADAKVKKAYKTLTNMGYYVSYDDPAGLYILFDEINAYTTTDPKNQITDLGLTKGTIKKLKSLYKTYVK